MVTQTPRRAAVVFDLDGVLADTEPVFCEGLRRTLAPTEMSDEQYASIIGFSDEATWHWVRATFNRPESIEEIRAACRPFTNQALAEAVLAPLEGALDLVRHLRETGTPIAIASQSSSRWISVVLEKTGMARYFDLVVTAAEVAAPKPAPHIYIEAASRLGFDPSDCIAVEDSATGIESAFAAGMRVIQLRQAPHTRAMPVHPSAHLVIDSHRDFPLTWLGRSRHSRA